METLTLEQFLESSKNIIISASMGHGCMITVPGSAVAVIISIQEYESLIENHNGKED